MGWFGNWQQDLTAIDQDTSSSWTSQHYDEEDFNITDFGNINETLKQCLEIFKEDTQKLQEKGGDFCPVITDGLLCWPPQPPDSLATVKCFAELNGIKYDDSQNATRICLQNGTWTKANYSSCTELEIAEDVQVQIIIYLVGYSVSLLSLGVAFGIFAYFKELRCLRNIIHMNLMCAYILMYVVWIIAFLTLTMMDGACSICPYIITVLHYFHTSTFFWMFVEGLYLYTLVVRTLRRGNFKLRIYVCIGWGLPVVFIAIWSVAKAFIPEKHQQFSYVFKNHPIDWIYQAPTLLILLLNLLFLLSIMWVLITKLRSTNSIEIRQYHKAAKALLVLIPLLGVTYVIIIYSPSTDKKTQNIFECVRALLLSTQGFTVALFYCFMNTEVQKTIGHHFDNWRIARSIPSSNNSSRIHRIKNDTRNDSIRLTDWTLVSTAEDAVSSHG